MEYQWELALIIGNEGKGISANIKKQVDEMITIPNAGACPKFECQCRSSDPYV